MEQGRVQAPPNSVPVPDRRRPYACRGAWLAAWLLVVTAACGRPLAELVRLAWSDTLYSHLLLIPPVSAYLLYRQRHRPVPRWRTSWLPAAVAFAAGLALLRLGIRLGGGPLPFPPEAVPALTTAGYLGLLYAGCFAWCGTPAVRARLFPLAFLLFLLPLPTALADAVNARLQQGSAHVAYLLLHLTGIPVHRDEFVFHMPGMAVEVATACSGIRSTLVLLITSVLAGYLLLRTPRARALTVLAVAPIALLRNGVRIWVICIATLYIHPEAIHSPLHTRGGQPFFALSLVVLFAVLMSLRHWERHRRAAPGAAEKGNPP